MPLADPGVVARLAAEAEEAGWQGVFVWDHVRWREPVTDVADAWITLAAIATATHDIRLGPMVTPLARRRPVKVARETATLDRLSDLRATPRFPPVHPTGQKSQECPQVDGHVLRLSGRHAKRRREGYRKNQRR
jgi:luciferase-like monooxygenase